MNDSGKLDSSAAALADGDVIRAYEDAATAIGRLDASGRLAPAGFRELLVLRCIATPASDSYTGMIALVQADGEGAGSHRGATRAAGLDRAATYAAALRTGAARARGGALPSVGSLHELLGLPVPTWPTTPIDELLRDVRERTPPVLKAALVALALRAAREGQADPTEPATAELAALAVTFVLCVGGATTDAWVTLPDLHGSAGHSLRDTFVALAREARAAERGLADAHELVDRDEQDLRDSLGRAAYSALDVLGLLREQIVITIPHAARLLGLTPPTAGAAVARLVELGIAHEVTGKARSRAFAYEGIVRAFEPEPASRR